MTTERPQRYTNVHNIDPVIARVVTDDPFYDTPDCDISVTGLGRPPQMAYLEQIHADEITEDVSDSLWRLLGSAVHEVIRHGAGANDFVEERLFCEIEGWKIAGKADLYRPDEPDHYEFHFDEEKGLAGSIPVGPFRPTVIDWKVTSVWSFLLGDKPDWEFQDNANAYIWRANGFPVERLLIKAILRDHSKREAAGREDYPLIPYQTVDIDLWNDDMAAAALATAVRYHQAARAGKPRLCRPDERWARPDKWAVMRKGQKRAVRLFEDADDANELAGQVPEGYVQERPGEQVRCGGYCSVRKWCSQADELGVPK